MLGQLHFINLIDYWGCILIYTSLPLFIELSHFESSVIPSHGHK